MSNVIREHYVPKFLLKSFANDTGEVWVYDKKEKNWFQSSPTNIGVEKGMYDQDVENWLSQDVEAPTSRILSDLANDRTELSEEELFVIAKFITVQRVRVRAIERYVELNQQDLVREKFQEILFELYGEPGMKYGAELLNQVGCDPKQLLMQLDLRNLCNLALCGAMSSNDFSMAECIVDMAWRVICTDKKQFILTDNPAVMGIPNKVSELPECVLPISKRQALHIGMFGVAGTLNEVRADDNLVRKLNDRILAGADRFVYAPVKANWISDNAHDKFPCHPKLIFDAPFIPSA